MDVSGFIHMSEHILARGTLGINDVLILERSASQQT